MSSDRLGAILVVGLVLLTPRSAAIALDGEALGDAVQKLELMPPWRQTLSAQQIDALFRHLRALCECKGGQ